jgi:hypothetical protein
LASSIAHAGFSDFEQITIDNTAGGKTLTVAKVAVSVTSVTCRLRTAQISVLWVDPGVKTVTSSVGQLMEIGDTLILTSREQMLNLRMIRTGSTSGQMDCTYLYTQAP